MKNYLLVLLILLSLPSQSNEVYKNNLVNSLVESSLIQRFIGGLYLNSVNSIIKEEHEISFVVNDFFRKYVGDEKLNPEIRKGLAGFKLEDLKLLYDLNTSGYGSNSADRVYSLPLKELQTKLYTMLADIYSIELKGAIADKEILKKAINNHREAIARMNGY